MLIVFVVWGFYETYFKYFPVFPASTNLFTHVHALLCSLWIVLLIIQPLLIATKRRLLHRFIGRLSYFVFPLMCLSFIPLMINVWNSPQPRNILFSLSGFIQLIVFYTLAIFYRKRPELHMRYMISNALVLVDPSVGRLVVNSLHMADAFSNYMPFAFVDIILVTLILYDLKAKQNFKPYTLALFLFLTYQILVLAMFWFQSQWIFSIITTLGFDFTSLKLLS